MHILNQQFERIGESENSRFQNDGFHVEQANAAMIAGATWMTLSIWKGMMHLPAPESMRHPEYIYTLLLHTGID
jgi:hypothetical protein